MSRATGREADRSSPWDVVHVRGVGLLFGRRAQLLRLKRLLREVGQMRALLAYYQRIDAWQRSLRVAGGGDRYCE